MREKGMQGRKAIFALFSCLFLFSKKNWGKKISEKVFTYHSFWCIISAKGRKLWNSYMKARANGCTAMATD